MAASSRALRSQPLADQMTRTALHLHKSHGMPQPTRIIRSDPYLDLRPFIEYLWMTTPAMCRAVFPDMFPRGIDGRGASREDEERFLAEHFDGKTIADHGYRFLKQALYSIALYNDERVKTAAQNWMEKQSEMFGDPKLVEQMLKYDKTRGFFDEQDVLDHHHDEVLLYRIMRYIQFKIINDRSKDQKPAAPQNKDPDPLKSKVTPPTPHVKNGLVQAFRNIHFDASIHERRQLQDEISPTTLVHDVSLVDGRIASRESVIHDPKLIIGSPSNEINQVIPTAPMDTNTESVRSISQEPLPVFLSEHQKTAVPASHAPMTTDTLIRSDRIDSLFQGPPSQSHTGPELADLIKRDGRRFSSEDNSRWENIHFVPRGQSGSTGGRGSVRGRGRGRSSFSSSTFDDSQPSNRFVAPRSHDRWNVNQENTPLDHDTYRPPPSRGQSGYHTRSNPRRMFSDAPPARRQENTRQPFTPLPRTSIPFTVSTDVQDHRCLVTRGHPSVMYSQAVYQVAALGVPNYFTQDDLRQFLHEIIPAENFLGAEVRASVTFVYVNNPITANALVSRRGADIGNGQRINFEVPHSATFVPAPILAPQPNESTFPGLRALPNNSVEYWDRRPTNPYPEDAPGDDATQVSDLGLPRRQSKLLHLQNESTVQSGPQIMHVPANFGVSLNDATTPEKTGFSGPLGNITESPRKSKKKNGKNKKAKDMRAGLTTAPVMLEPTTTPQPCPESVGQPGTGSTPSWEAPDALQPLPSHDPPTQEVQKHESPAPVPESPKSPVLRPASSLTVTKRAAPQEDGDPPTRSVSNPLTVSRRIPPTPIATPRFSSQGHSEARGAVEKMGHNLESPLAGSSRSSHQSPESPRSMVNPVASSDQSAKKKNSRPLTPCRSNTGHSSLRTLGGPDEVDDSFQTAAESPRSLPETPKATPALPQGREKESRDAVQCGERQRTEPESPTPTKPKPTGLDTNPPSIDTTDISPPRSPTLDIGSVSAAPTIKVDNPDPLPSADKDTEGPDAVEIGQIKDSLRAQGPKQTESLSPYARPTQSKKKDKKNKAKSKNKGKLEAPQRATSGAGIHSGGVDPSDHESGNSGKAQAEGEAPSARSSDVTEEPPISPTRAVLKGIKDGMARPFKFFATSRTTSKAAKAPSETADRPIDGPMGTPDDGGTDEASHVAATNTTDASFNRLASNESPARTSSATNTAVSSVPPPPPPPPDHQGDQLTFRMDTPGRSTNFGMDGANSEPGSDKGKVVADADSLEDAADSSRTLSPTECRSRSGSLGPPSLRQTPGKNSHLVEAPTNKLAAIKKRKAKKSKAKRAGDGDEEQGSQAVATVSSEENVSFELTRLEVGSGIQAWSIVKVPTRRWKAKSLSQMQQKKRMEMQHSTKLLEHQEKVRDLVKAGDERVLKEEDEAWERWQRKMRGEADPNALALHKLIRALT